MPGAPHFLLPFLATYRFQSGLDGKSAFTVQPFTERTGTMNGSKVVASFFSGIASEQGFFRTLDNREDPRPAGYIPCQDDPDTCSWAPKILGWQGRTRVPLVDTPSLNPGLWYNWYPPIASRRQAKKQERRLQRVPGVPSAWEEQSSAAPCSMYAGSGELDVR